MNTKRLKITAVHNGSNAQRAGLAVGDILESCNRIKLYDIRCLERVLLEKNQLFLRVIRNGFVLGIKNVSPFEIGIEVSEADCREELAFQELIDNVEAFHRYSLNEMLEKHIGRQISINASKPTETLPAILVQVTNEFFTILVNNYLLTFPHSQITRIHSSLKFEKLTIIVDHLIVHEGGTQLGLGAAALLPFSTDK